MSITHRILGRPGQDNALFVQVDSGQSIERLLFDCGEGCVSELLFAEVLNIDHLFLSHGHMDHIAGFDSFFRATFDRDAKPNRIWGPPQTSRIVQHRLQGYLWNLHEQMSATWRVSDVHPAEIRTTRFELGEAFAVAHDDGATPYAKTILNGATFTVEAVTMDHRTPTLGYIVREKARQNVDPARLSAMGLRPGPWLKQLKESTDAGGTITIEGVARSVGELREALFVETPGDSIAYLTDFLLDDAAMLRLVEALRGCRVMVCEAQYRAADLDLAKKHYHMTTALTATLAQRAGVQELVLFHLSSRYQSGEWLEMLEEARAVFPNTRYPEPWNLDGEPGEITSSR